MGAAAVTSRLEAWDDYHRAMSAIATGMIGAASYFAEHPEYATDERLAQTFREYAERMESVEVPS